MKNDQFGQHWRERSVPHQSKLGSSTKILMGYEVTWQKGRQEGWQVQHSLCWPWLVGVDSFLSFWLWKTLKKLSWSKLTEGTYYLSRIPMYCSGIQPQKQVWDEWAISTYWAALQVLSILILVLKQTRLSWWALWSVLETYWYWDHQNPAVCTPWTELLQLLSKLNISRMRKLVWEHVPNDTPSKHTYSLSNTNPGSFLVCTGGRRPCEVQHLRPLQLVVSHTRGEAKGGLVLSWGDVQCGKVKVPLVLNIEHWTLELWRWSATLAIKVQAFNVQGCDTKRQSHTLQEQTNFHEICITISHAKHCTYLCPDHSQLPPAAVLGALLKLCDVKATWQRHTLPPINMYEKEEALCLSIFRDSCKGAPGIYKLPRVNFFG